ncbi:response regulator transcription factor [Aquabacterium sp.]|uniref:LuxR C-terminal-related transcriptional regulator n=1 Tax=Aquabacterium sp. TaxID=1872578 RepID=UPI0025BD1A5C|nr:response regulator transcription factor [Aquabacterium sp.]
MKLLLIDDHALFRDGLTLLMTLRLRLPGESLEVLQAGNLGEAAAVLALHPDVSLALLDLGLPDHQGLGTLHLWRELAPHVPVVVLSADDRPDTIISAIDAGASGFIPKTVHTAVMQEAISRVLAGGVYLPALPCAHGAEAGHWLDDPLDGEEALDGMGFSDRQVDVLRLLIEGKANKEICRLLNLSESTVKTHLGAIFRKLKVNSRTQAVVAIAKAGVSLKPAL